MIAVLSKHLALFRNQIISLFSGRSEMFVHARGSTAPLWSSAVSNNLKPNISNDIGTLRENSYDLIVWRPLIVLYLARYFLLTNQYWVIVNVTLTHKRQWKFKQNTKLFSHENASKNVICEMAAILPRGRWVNELIDYFDLLSSLPLPRLQFSPIAVKLGRD